MKKLKIITVSLGFIVYYLDVLDCIFKGFAPDIKFSSVKRWIPSINSYFKQGALLLLVQFTFSLS